jgi:tetratricopeptide (TPR) repeat protein
VAGQVQTRDVLIDHLAGVHAAGARARFLRKHRELIDPAVVEELYGRVVRLARVDVDQADRLALAARRIANTLGDSLSRAQSIRAQGHVRFIRGEHAAALKHYDAAAKLYRRAGRDVDVARTLNGSIQSLISLGKYAAAHASARKARVLFERHGVELGLARLDSNAANIFSRQDRWDKALPLYRRAYEELSKKGEAQDVAAVLSNLALAYINLNDFERALTTYREARAYCERHGMPLLVLQADYNIAYLYYLRGEYTRALDLYRTAYDESERVGDGYHSGLCDLDRSEIFLELNLNEEAADLADRALGRFGRLRMLYEEGKAMTNLALAASRRGGVRRSRTLFARARRLFAHERNDVWLALVDFYEALVLYRDGQPHPSRELAAHARRLFARASVPVRAAACELLLARLDLHAGRLHAAEEACRAVVQQPATADTPMLAYQSQFLLGLIREAQGDREAALDGFRHAYDSLEQLRSRLQGDNLKIAFFEDKQAVYESLVAASVTSTPTHRQMDAAFGYIEHAKSRSLADLIAFRAASLTPRSEGGTTAVRDVRQSLNWHYRQIDAEEASRQEGATRRVDVLRRRARGLEQQLERSLDEIRRTDEEFSALQGGATFNVGEVRESLGPDAVLLEYYQARGQLYVCVLGQKDLDIVPLGPIAQVRRELRLLQFQLSKFRLGPEFIGAVGEQLQAATLMHLRELYDVLIAPVRDRLKARHLVIVPHDLLHFLPFHALFDGERYLIDDFSLSFAPSASVYRLCWAKQPRSGGDTLIMGVPDLATPFITDEVESVAEVLPNTRVLMGGAATAAELRQHGAGSRIVHIATHGVFRHDNPLFSSIRLGDGPLCAYELYELQLPADLVTLSGCSTGLSVVAGGDEQLGLVRGLLYAGARAVLLTLWDVNDHSTSAFMKAFYSRLRDGWGKAHAAQQAMRELRERYAHPYYWAPFALIGNVDAP